MSTKDDLVVTDRVLEKIGDHFNNPEMSDRILIVKVRPLGWEIHEAAKLAKNAVKTSDVNDGVSERTLKHEKATDNASPVPRIDKKSSNSSENVNPADPADADHELQLTDTESQPLLNSDVEKCTKDENNSKCGTKRRKNQSLDNSFLSEECGAEDSKCETTLPDNDDTLEINKKEKNIPDETFTAVECEEEIVQADKRVRIEELTVLSDKEVDSCVVCEHEIFVHSFWLALNSPFFRGLFFSSGMKETKDNKVVMNVCQSKAAMFLVLIESLYRPEVIFNKSVDELLILMRLAHAYDAETTLKTCQRILESAELSISICDKALNMQDHERLPEMESFNNRCQQFLVDSFSPLDYQWTREDFFSLSANALQTVLSSNELCVSNENTVFLALMRWAEVNETYGGDLKPLTELVRFKAMTINYLHDIVTSEHPIASTVPNFTEMFEEAVFFHAFSKERQADEGDQVNRKAFDEPILFNWHVENYEDTEFEKKKKIVKSPHFWVSGYEMFLELKLRSTGFQGLYLTICTRQFLHQSKGFVKLKYSLSSNFLKATHVFNEVDVFDKEGSGWGYEEFFPLVWADFKEQLKRNPLIITAQVRLLE